MAHIVGVVSRIRCRTFHLSHDFLDSPFIGSVSGVGCHLYKDLFVMKEVDLVPFIV